MLPVTFDFKNHVWKYPSSHGKKNVGILLLHGFPAESANNTPQEKNQDLGLFLASQLNRDTYIHHYNGLGKNQAGKFSFIDSINDSVELISKLLKHHDTLMLVGHSWGGTVAINCFLKMPEKISKLILLSPFIAIPSSKALRPILQSMCNDFPYILENQKIDTLIHELEIIKEKLNLNEIGEKTSIPNTLIIQATQDNEVSPSDTQDLSVKFQGKATYELFESDHSFDINRIKLLQRSVQFLADETC